MKEAQAWKRITELEDELARLRAEVVILLDCPVCQEKLKSIGSHQHLERLRELATDG